MMIGCESTNLKQSYLTQPKITIQVNKITNQSGKNFDIDVESILSNALTDKLLSEYLLYTNKNNKPLLLNCKIIEYEPGNPLKRWLESAWGSPKITIQCDLYNGDKLIGTVDTSRRLISGTATVGGEYSSQAWRIIFSDIAEDIIDKLKSKI